MIKKILWITVLGSNLINATEIVNKESNTTQVPTSTKNSGFYTGLSMGLLNWGGEVILNDGTTSKTFDVKTKDKPIMLKLGYVTESENRVEVYYKSDSIDVKENSTFNLYDTSTFGIDYQWGLSSLSTNEMLPYIRVGIGVGSAKIENASADLNAVDVDLGIGIHYQVATSTDISAGLYRRVVGISSDNSDATILSAMNGVEMGINYHF